MYRLGLQSTAKVITKRLYSDFLKNLPKTPNKKPNRFAEKFDKPKLETKPPRSKDFAASHKSQPKQPKASNDQRTKHNDYQQARERLRSIESKQRLHETNGKNKKDNKPNKSSNSMSSQKSSNTNKQVKTKILVPTFVTVSNLSSILNIPLNKFLKSLESMGFENMRHSYILDKENVSLIADEFGYEINMNDDTGLDLFPSPEPDMDSNNPDLKNRAPIVTIMGHVDHGKTTILDYLRKSSIVAKEFGGITQHIGAFSVLTPISKKKITFLDTPGHAAFLKMRERGANITDIVILVVAADDSVMPQTIEAIKHAKKAEVPVIVAINKCDKHGVNVDKVLSDLARYEIDIEDYGGETQTVQVSGKTGLNMDKLEEAIVTLSEMNEIKAETKGIPSEGWIIESEVVKGMGPIATGLVRRSSIKPGDFLVSGTTYCKVRGMKDESGKPIKLAGPSTPVQLWGWKELPEAGEPFIQAKNEQIAKKVVNNRITRQKELTAMKDIETLNAKRQEEIELLARQEKINELKLQGFSEKDLEEEFDNKNKAKEVKYIIKSDVFGSAEAIKESIEGLGNEEVKAIVISHEAGAPTDSDIDMANALAAKIFCFNVKIPRPIQNKAYTSSVELVEHNIIYRLIEDVTNDLSSKLDPVIETKILCDVDIQSIFTLTNKQKKKTKVAGSKVMNGLLRRSSKVKVLRKDQVVYTGSLASLKHVKDDITEAKKGLECGIAFANWDKFQEGDKVQAYEEIHHKRYL